MQNHIFCPYFLQAKFSLVETKGEYIEEEMGQRGFQAPEESLTVFNKGEEEGGRKRAKIRQIQSTVSTSPQSPITPASQDMQFSLP